VFVSFGLFVWELNHIDRTRCNYHIYSVYIFLVSVRRIYAKFSTTSRFNLNQFDYSLSISMHDSWLGLHPHQLSGDGNLELIISLVIRGKCYLAYVKLKSKKQKSKNHSLKSWIFFLFPKSRLVCCAVFLQLPNITIKLLFFSRSLWYATWSRRQARAQ